jgi:hypothetical protein
MATARKRPVEGVIRFDKVSLRRAIGLAIFMIEEAMTFASHSLLRCP